MQKGINRMKRLKKFLFIVGCVVLMNGITACSRDGNTDLGTVNDTVDDTIDDTEDRLNDDTNYMEENDDRGNQ